eukprot:5280411-Pyramimonas_sp.AAC.1
MSELASGIWQHRRERTKEVDPPGPPRCRTQLRNWGRGGRANAGPKTKVFHFLVPLPEGYVASSADR